ncbi:hypothetical protein HQ533_02980 [Candidatus Woesearchaeota archaeon]|nr:hypothetical protein [Candidatus Woesearchaeota archaeon]
MSETFEQEQENLEQTILKDSRITFRDKAENFVNNVKENKLAWGILGAGVLGIFWAYTAHRMSNSFDASVAPFVEATDYLRAIAGATKITIENNINMNFSSDMLEPAHLLIEQGLENASPEKLNPLLEQITEAKVYLDGTPDANKTQEVMWDLYHQTAALQQEGKGIVHIFHKSIATVVAVAGVGLGFADTAFSHYMSKTTKIYNKEDVMDRFKKSMAYVKGQLKKKTAAGQQMFYDTLDTLKSTGRSSAERLEVAVRLASRVDTEMYNPVQAGLAEYLIKTPTDSLPIGTIRYNTKKIAQKIIRSAA